MSLDRVERQLAQHIRNPAEHAGPAGMEPRRLKIYRDLFYNNIEGFISSGFPVLRSLLADQPWHAMVRDFLARHHCQTPYFLEISQEFLLYLQQTRVTQPDDPVFMTELAHYEWVELALDVADEEVTDSVVDPDGDLLLALPVVSPLAWSLCYHYPVHRIGSQFQPQQADEQATYLIVYRDRTDTVGFMEANSVTARLLELLQSGDVGNGEQALLRIAEEMQHPQPRQVIDGGLDILQQLRQRDIILGSVD